MSVSLAAILAESAVRHRDRPAVVLGDMRITYQQLWGATRQYAAVLRERGIGPGDKVALLLPNTPHFPLSYFAVLALGAVAVPVHALLTSEEIAFVLSDSGSKALICAAPLLGEGAKGAEIAGVELLGVMDGGDETVTRLDTLASAATPIETYVPREPDDIAVVLYTSGTTGKPKGALLTHVNILMNVDVSVIDTFTIGPEDVVLGCLPLFHTFGQTCAMNTGFRAGASLVLMPRFDGAGALDLLVREKCTIFMGVPTMYIGLLAAAKSDERRPQLKAALSGGAALPMTVLEEFKEIFGADISEGYGLSETSPVATFNQAVFGRKPGTVGCAIWGVEVEIAKADIDDRIELLPTGEIGEVVIRGHNIFAGYLNNPEATAAAIVDGWFRSGDLGTKDDEGFITIVDRKKDMVLRGGYNVYPREVEEVLVRHPGIAQVAVIAVPDAEYGEEVCACIIPAEEGADADALATDVREWAKQHLAKHKYPRVIHVVDSFPLGPSGKVLKRELVARFAE